MIRREKLEQIVTIFTPMGLTHPAAYSGQCEARVPSRKVQLHVN